MTDSTLTVPAEYAARFREEAAKRMTGGSTRVRSRASVRPHAGLSADDL